MKIYFVRHGDTGLVKQGIMQADTSPLCEQGLLQVQALAARFAGITLDKVISSPLTRALQTAQELSPAPLISELFIETKKPSCLIGRSKVDPDVVQIFQQINDKYISDPSWRYSDEENYEDLKARGLAALDYLITLEADCILVVSHANFIALMAGLMVFGKDFPANVALKWKRFLRLANTGVTTCTYENDRWQLHSWNDTSHLLP